MPSSIFKQMGSAVKTLVDTTKADLEAQIATLSGGSGSPELAPRTGVPNGAILQKLANGVRWVDVIDGGNAAGVVSYPAWGFPAQPGGTAETWSLGQTDFTFTTGEFTPATNFTF